jgi:hypothetical protein
MQSVIITILAKLSVIKFGNIGKKCFKTLADFMKSGRELENSVADVLKNVIINSLIYDAEDLEKVSVSHLEGLHFLIEQTSNSHILEILYQKCFPLWIKKYCKKLDKAAKNRQIVSNDERYDMILALISISVDDNDQNIKLVKEKGMEKEIS